MESRRLALPVIVCALLVGANARALEPGEDHARSGWYVGLGAVYAFEDFDGDAAQLALPDPPYAARFEPRFDDSAGIHLLGGYRVTPHFALELGYEWLEGFDAKAAEPDLEVDSHLITLDAKLFALTGRVQPFARAGVGVHLANIEIVDGDFRKPWEESSGFAARFGIGVDYYLTRHWVVGVEGRYVLSTGDTKHFDYGGLMLGAQYRF